MDTTEFIRERGQHLVAVSTPLPPDRATSVAEEARTRSLADHWAKTVDISNDDPPAVRRMLRSLAIDNRASVVVVWASTCLAITLTLDDFIASYDDLWYPSSDDVWIFDPDKSWLIEFDHEEVVRFRGE